MLVEDVVEQDQLLSKSRCDVHGHCHGGDHKIALINQVDELPQGKMSEIPRAAALGDAEVLLVLLFAAKEERYIPGMFQAFGECDPVLLRPESGHPTATASGIQPDDGFLRREFPGIAVTGEIVEDVLFAAEGEARNVKYLFDIAPYILPAQIIEHPREVLRQCLCIDGNRFAVRQSEPLLLVGAQDARQCACFPVFVQIDQLIKMYRLQAGNTLRREWQNDIDNIGDDFRTEREPPDPALGCDFLKLAEERRGADNIAQCAKFDDQRVARLRKVIRTDAAIHLSAMAPFLFVRPAGNVTAEPAAIRFQSVKRSPRLDHWGSFLFDVVPDRVFFGRRAGLADHLPKEAYRNELDADDDEHKP